MAKGLVAMWSALALVALSSPMLYASQAGAQSSTGGNAAASGQKMDKQAKADVFHQVLQQLGAGQPVDPKLFGEFVAAQNDDLQTGPAVGEKVPDFTLPDQYGRPHSLHELMGRDGLLLVFTRSADW